MKPKEHQKRTQGQKPLTPSPSQTPKTNNLSYDCVSALLRAVMTPPQVSEPENSPCRYVFRLAYNGPTGPEIVSQGQISLTPEQIPGFSVTQKNLRPYLTDDIALAWFKKLKHSGPGQPSGTKGPFWMTSFEDMLNARDALVARWSFLPNPPKGYISEIRLQNAQVDRFVSI
jgi:hypothetical protein